MRILAVITPLILIFVSGCSSLHCGAAKSQSGKTFEIPSQRFSFSAERQSHEVLTYAPDSQSKSNGAAVLLLHEIFGPTAECLQLAERISQAGYTVYVPVLFGNPGRSGSTWLFLKHAALTSLDPDWKPWAKERTGRICHWLARLSAHISAQHPAQGVKAIGMCYTGIFPVSLLSQPHVDVAVICQPATPINPFQTSRRKAALGIDRDDVKKAAASASESNKVVLGFRFEADRLSPPEKFSTLGKEFGSRFRPVTIPHSDYVRHGISPKAHSVLTINFVDDAGHPTCECFETMIEVFNRSLHE